jgi:hypothetical protein
VAREDGEGAQGDQLQAARLAVLAPALLGSGSDRVGRRRPAAARTDLPSCPSWPTSSPPGAGSARECRGWTPPTRPPVRRETNTMPQWAGSCWYYLRSSTPRTGAHVDRARYWMPVDLYVGGASMPCCICVRGSLWCHSTSAS